MRAIAAFVFAILALVEPASAELKWQGTGPGGGGAFESMAVSTDGVVFVGSDLSGAYRSVDGGESWRAIGYRNGLLSTHVDGVAVDPARPATVLISADSGLYVSKDCGKAVDAGCHFIRKFEGQVTVVAFTTGGVAYAAGVAGYCQEGALIWRSNDHGLVWAKMNAMGLPRSFNVMALRVQVGNAEHVIAISSPERFSGPQTCGAGWPDAAPRAAYESFDGGANFSPLLLPSALAVEDVKFDLRSPSHVWATVTPYTDDVKDAGAVYRRAGAAGFELVSSELTGQIWPLSGGGIRLLDLRRQRPWHNLPFNAHDQTGFWEWDETARKFEHVTSAGDYQKWDMGWSGILHAPQASLNGHLQSFTPQNDDQAWWVDDQFIHKITGGGKNVVNDTTKHLSEGGFASRHIDNAVGAVLAPSSVDPNLLYAGYFDLGCWSSSDASAAEVSWRACNGGQIQLQADGKFENSKLNGWWHGYGGNVVAIAPDPVDSKVVWAVHAPHNGEQGTEASGYYKIAKSSDGFATYDDVTYDLRELSNAAAIVSLGVDVPGKGLRRLWAIAGGRLYKLDHGAKNWDVVDTKSCDGGLLVIALQAQLKVAGGTSGICVSHDGGINWHASRDSERWGDPRAVWWSPFDSTPSGISDFAFDPKNASRIWMTAMLPSTDKVQPRAGLYRSDDAGETWAHVESFGALGSKQRNFARTVAVNGTDPNMIAVGTSVASVAGGFLADVPMGAFISRDGGRSWRQENNGLSWPFITKLRFVGARLYALSPGQGIVFADVK